MKGILKRFYCGIIKENPVFALAIGLCPAIAVTTTAINGLAMGIATAIVLVFANVIASLLSKIIPQNMRVPAYLIISAGLTTIVDMLMHAYAISVYSALGVFVPLIAVSGLVIGRAEEYACKSNVVLSLFDGLGMGIGYIVALTLIGIIRELLASGSVFGKAVMPESFEPVSMLAFAPGAFIVIAFICALHNKLMSVKKGAKKADDGDEKEVEE